MQLHRKLLSKEGALKLGTLSTQKKKSKGDDSVYSKENVWQFSSVATDLTTVVFPPGVLSSNSIQD